MKHPMVTWTALIEIEPRLKTLEAEAKAHAALDRAKRRLLAHHSGLLPESVRQWAEQSCANDIWYAPYGLKHRLCELVGWGARNPELRTSESYDLAYDHIYGLLPDCRNCWCL